MILQSRDPPEVKKILVRMDIFVLQA